MFWDVLRDSARQRPSRPIPGRRRIAVSCATAVVLLTIASSLSAQATSSVRIPLKKAKPPVALTPIHDTVVVVRVDTVRVVETVYRTDTLFRTDTVRDSCSRGAMPIPFPIPIPIDHGSSAAIPTSVTPEPQTLFLVGTGLSGLIAVSYFRRRK